MKRNPRDHPARYYVRVAEMLDLSAFEAQYWTHMGRKSYAPAMMLALWLYGYMTGVNSSRKLEQATREQLPFMYIAAAAEPEEPFNLLADAGYFRTENVEACETRNVNAYIANKRNGRATALKTRSSAAVSEMVTRMGTEAGKTLYGKRKSTVETTFGCIKDAMGFRFPKMRGLAGVQIEWQLVCLAWNLKRTFNLRGGSLF